MIQGFINAVYSAKLNSDGTLGSWNALTNMPIARHWATSYIASGYIYITGGTTKDAIGRTYHSDTIYAKLNSDGTIGSRSAAKAIGVEPLDGVHG